jgi:branched-chain amino acid transport system ATP-binding protein
VTVLEAVGLHKSFGGVHAVAGVSFAVRRGEMLALIGPNGAGKSTCFGLIGGQLRPDGGTVRLAGADITARAPHALARLGVARTFQIASVFASMTVRENVQVALEAHHRLCWQFWSVADARFRRSAMALLAKVEMDDQADRAAGVLAYGDLKRLELAIALAANPRLLLMDEPTAGMGGAERAALMALVRRFAKDTGLAVLFTEHDMQTVFGVADRILVLDRGEVIAEGNAAAIRADARVREVYLGSEAEAPCSR